MTGPDGIGGLKAKLIAMLAGNTKVGKTEEELQKMSVEELMALKEDLQAGLSGKGAEFTDGFVRSTNNKTTEAPKESERKNNIGGYIAAGAIAIGAGIIGGIKGAAAGAGSGAVFGGIGAVPGAIIGAIAGIVIGVGTALGLSACTKEKDPVAQINLNNYNQNETNITIVNNYDEVVAALEANGYKLDEILKLMEQMQQTNQTGFQNIQDQLQHLSAQQEAQFYVLLGKLDELGLNVTTVLSNIGDDLSAAIQYMTELLQENSELLQQILEKLGDLETGMQQNFQALIAQVLATGGDLGALLEQIKALLETNNDILNEHSQILNQILAAIQGLDSHLQAGVMQIITQIMNSTGDISALLEQLKALLQTNNNILNQHTQVLNDILAAIQGLDANLQAGIMQLLTQIMNSTGDINAALEEIKQLLQTNNALLTQIYNKLNQMDAHMQEGFNAMIAQIIQSGGNITEKLEQLLAAINAITPAIIEAINNINPGNVDLQPVINAINALNNNVSAQAASLYALLAHISSQIDDVNDKLNAIHTIATQTLNVAQHMDGDLHTIIGLLNQIIDGQCEDCCDAVIELLQQILTAIVTGTNDEGFTGDEYNDLLG